MFFVLSLRKSAEAEQQGFKIVDSGNAIQDFDEIFQCCSLNISVILGFYCLKMDVNSQKGNTLKCSCWLVRIANEQYTTIQFKLGLVSQYFINPIELCVCLNMRVNS